MGPLKQVAADTRHSLLLAPRQAGSGVLPPRRGSQGASPPHW